MTRMVRRTRRQRGRPGRSLISLLFTALLVVTGAFVTPIVTAPQSYAAPGDAFDAADPYVFVAQGTPTRLYKAITGASGAVTFQPEGAASPITYNGISYNTADNYLYGVVAVGNASFPTGSLIRIGQGGVISRVGTLTVPNGGNLAAFGPDGYLYVGNTPYTAAYRVNVATGQSTPITLSVPPNTGDIAYADGYFWGATDNGQIVRVDFLNPAPVKPVTFFPVPFLTLTHGYGGAWTFGNGNIGLSNNVTGLVTQVKITNPGSANPTFTVVSTSPGPSSSNNDGASSPGLPTDLSIVKNAPGSIKPGSPVTYTLTVKNNGPGNSSGYTVKDTVPAPLTDVASSTPGCTVSGNTVTCVGGRTLAGAENTITITANSPATMTGCVTNAASVLANEQDPVSENNQSEAEICAEEPGLTLEKTADPTTVSAVGEQVTYSYVLTNTGNVALADPGVTETDFSGSPSPTVECPAGPLAPGKSLTCTASYTVTQADLDAGSIENTATAHGTPPGETDPMVSEPDTATVGVTSDSDLKVVKSASTSSPDELVLGEEITYSFVVTNTGNVTLKDVKVDEVDFTGSGTLSPVTCPAGAASLAPGASVTCTATYTVTQADVDAGEITNSATSTGTPPSGPPPVSPPSEVTVPSTPDPAVSLTKTASKGKLVAGEEITYNFVVTNTGNVTLTDVKVDEGEFTGSGELSPVTCPAGAASMLPGASVTCTATYTVTQADVDAGSVKNTATSTGTPPSGPPPVSPPAETTVNTDDKPGLKVEKSSSTDKLVAGEEITYEFVVTNTGNVTLKDVKVDEGEFTGSGDLGPAVCPAGAASLAPGASITCTATYTVTQADVDKGSVKNTATATGTPPRGEPPVSPPSETTVTGDDEPGISVVKSATSSEKDKLVVGEEIDYSFLVTNTGNVTLKDVKVDEGEFTGSGEMGPVACPAGAASMAPGASVTCTATYTVTQADVDAGSIKNTATSTGTPPRGEPPVSPPSEAEVPGTSEPALKVVKSATTSESDELVLGEEITYNFVVTNTGNVTLKDVKVDEVDFTGSGELSPVTCPAGAASMAPGASVTCTATYTVTQADVDAGEITNSATSTGTPPSGPPPVSPPSEVTVPSTPDPALTIAKTASTGKLVAGEEITYNFVVTNTGNVTLKDVKVDEGEFTGSGELSPVTCPAGAASMLPGASVTCTATYTVTQADVDAGSIKNTATSTGTPPSGPPPVSPPGETTVNTDDKPGLKVEKSSSTDKLVAGEEITYEFVVTNTGNVTLKDVKVDEGEFTGSGKLSPVTCPAGAKSMAPGASVTCTATYKVTQADVDAGSVKNTATSTGTPPRGEPPVSPPSETTVTGDDEPGISVVKSATSSQDNKLVAGEEVTYEFVVTNTGNVTLKDVKVDEGEFTGSGALSPVTCPAGAASMAPGASVTCTATYKVTQADVDAGSIENTATSTGTPPRGEPPVSPPSEAELPGTPEPALTVVKSASTDKLVVGEEIGYEFLVTNTGNVTLKDVTVDEEEFTGSGKLSPVACPAGAAAMAPGASVTCTATYKVTQADVDAGSIKNTATSTGTPPEGEPPVSPPSTVTVPETPQPALTVVKTAKAEKPGKLVVGEEIGYSFLVTNTGNVTLKDVTVDEGEFTGSGKLSPVTCPAGAKSMAPGASVTCTATYKVTQADVDKGSIKNTATGTGTPPNGKPPVSPPSTVTVPSDGKGKIGLTKAAEVTDVNKNGRTDAGDRIDWKFTVANEGPLTITGIKVVDPTAGAVTCPKTSLDPGQTMKCSAKPHIITSEEAARGKVVNTATATGKSGGSDITSPEATATVKVTSDTPTTPVHTDKPGTPKPAPTGVLSKTGTTAIVVASIAAGLLLVGGLVFGLSKRQRRSH
ncbi:DUF7507 domain-containing protein [Streptomyces sp. NPDC004838]